MKRSEKSKRFRYLAEEAENMILNDLDSRDSNIDLGENLSDDGSGTYSDLDAESEEVTADQEESIDVEVSDNRTNATPTSSSG